MVEIPYLNYIYIAPDGTIIIPDSMDGTLSPAPSTNKLPIAPSNFNFDLKWFKDNTYTLDGNRFEATVVDCEGFFGVDLTQNEIDISITFRRNTPRIVNIVYTDDAGYEVSITLNYEYTE